MVVGRGVGEVRRGKGGGGREEGGGEESEEGESGEPFSMQSGGKPSIWYVHGT
jgi:hypothetical protein